MHTYVHSYRCISKHVQTHTHRGRWTNMHKSKHTRTLTFTHTDMTHRHKDRHLYEGPSTPAPKVWPAGPGWAQCSSSPSRLPPRSPRHCPPQWAPSPRHRSWGHSDQASSSPGRNGCIIRLASSCRDISGIGWRSMSDTHATLRLHGAPLAVWTVCLSMSAQAQSLILRVFQCRSACHCPSHPRCM